MLGADAVKQVSAMLGPLIFSARNAIRRICISRLRNRLASGPGYRVPGLTETMLRKNSMLAAFLF